ncbi:MAG: 23 protein [Thermoproteota archaeon]|nr:23 protein [Thermoproteota archaeon]
MRGKSWSYDQISRRHNEERKKIEAKKRQLADGVAKAEGLKGRVSTLKQSMKDLTEEKKKLEEQVKGLWVDLNKIGYEGEDDLTSLKDTADRLDRMTVETLSMINTDEKIIEEEQNRESALSDTEICPYCGQRLSSHKAKEFRLERTRHLENLKKKVKENGIVLDSSMQLLKAYKTYIENLDRLLLSD